MAAPLRRSALAAALAVFAATSLHANPDGGITERVMALVRADYESARAALEQRTSECLRQQTREVDPAVLQSLGLTQRQMEVAAYVLADRAMAACEAPAKGQFALAVAAYRSVSRHYGQDLPTEVAREDELLMNQRWKRLEKEVTAYATLSDTQRRQLESHAELRAPFDFIGLLEKLRRSR